MPVDSGMRGVMGKLKKAATRPKTRGKRWPGRITIGPGPASAEPSQVDWSQHRGPFRTDLSLDGWSTRELTIRAASVRGDSHRVRRKPRQDDFAVVIHEPTNAAIVAVCDGVSAAAQSHLAATAACRHTVGTIQKQLDTGGELDWNVIMRDASWAVVEVAQRAEGSGSMAPDQVAADYATTIVAAVVWPSETGMTLEAAAVGDSGVLHLSGKRVQYVVGQRDNDLAEVRSSSTVALPLVPEMVEPVRRQAKRSDVFLVATDGFLDPLGGGTGSVGKLLLETLMPTPPETLQFGRVADFYRETFDDDRTLVAVWRR